MNLNIRGLMTKAAKGISKHSPTILTGLSVAGLVTTVIFAVKETPRAMTAMEKLKAEHGDEPVPTLEVVKTLGKVYAPTAVMGGVTVACMIGSTRASTKKNAALVSLYSASEAALKEYEGKVVEMIGEKKEHKIHDEIAKQKIAENPITDNTQIIVTGNGKCLCYDAWSGRYFWSDMDKLQRAETALNKEIISEMWVTMNELYYHMGLPPVMLGEELGWNVDHMCEMRFSSQLVSDTGTQYDGQPCLVVDFVERPKYYDSGIGFRR